MFLVASFPLMACFSVHVLATLERCNGNGLELTHPGSPQVWFPLDLLVCGPWLGLVPQEGVRLVSWRLDFEQLPIQTRFTNDISMLDMTCYFMLQWSLFASGSYLPGLLQ